MGRIRFYNPCITIILPHYNYTMQSCTRVTYLSGSGSVMDWDCETVLQTKVRLCAINTNWLPNEVLIFDSSGKELSDDALVPEEVSALWSEKDRTLPRIWRAALSIFGADGNEEGACFCAREMVSAHEDLAISDFSTACDACDVSVVSAYISAGMKVSIVGDKLKRNSEFGKLCVVRTLLEAKADANFSDMERRKPTSLHVSAESGHSEVVHALLAAKADANIADEGVTPLHRSSKKTGKTSVVQALLAAKADVNFVSDDGRTPLLQCCFDGRIDVAEILLGASGDPNVADKNGD